MSKQAKKMNEIRIRQVRSAIGRPRNQRQVLDGLGLRRIRHEVVRQDTPAVRGMVAKIPHLVEIVGDAPKAEAAAKGGPSASAAVAAGASAGAAVAADASESEEEE